MVGTFFTDKFKIVRILYLLELKKLKNCNQKSGNKHQNNIYFFVQFVLHTTIVYSDNKNK